MIFVILHYAYESFTVVIKKRFTMHLYLCKLSAGGCISCHTKLSTSTNLVNDGRKERGYIASKPELCHYTYKTEFEQCL